MANDSKRHSRLSIAIIGVAAVMLIAASAENNRSSGSITGYVFAYNRNQATGAANDCGNGQEPTNIGCQNTDSQIQGDENSAAITSQQTFPSVTRGESPTTSEPTGFTIEGKGLVRSNSFTCGGIPFPDFGFVHLRFSARDDSENFNGNFGFLSSGTYSVTISRPGVPDKVTEGVLDSEYTLGPLFPIPDNSHSTFTLKGDFHDNESVCVVGIPLPPTVMISGICGRDEEIRFEDSAAEATFFGDVDCTLTF